MGYAKYSSADFIISALVGSLLFWGEAVSAETAIFAVIGMGIWVRFVMISNGLEDMFQRLADYIEERTSTTK
ncbi:MAG TPA: hypothetical protein DCZ05_15640 [Deltaproteobacteria bacterium]|nr:hypothetical protein [Deltaproteobacteria bacterium]